MQNIGLLGITLICGFILQIAWWRSRRPTLTSVLSIFTLVFVGLGIAGLYWDILRAGAAERALLTLFYGSIVLTYTALCSAIEVPSPTLSIVTYVADRGLPGCPQDELKRHFLALDAMTDRLKLMEVSGLVQIASGQCALTNRGRLFARLFDFAARFFGLPNGG
jgi:hypothetical protein